MNRSATRKLVDKNGVITIQARTDRDSLPEIQKLMDELGNTGHGIPFLVIYPSDGSTPITFDGPLTQQMVLDALEKAGKSKKMDPPLPSASSDVRTADVRGK